MAESRKRVQRAQRWIFVVISIVAVVALIRLGGQLQRRIMFPWDLLTCFESPHLAALAKLHNGEPLYGPAADANSEPYPPLTVWISYALLKPLGLELDIRGARAVAVVVTLLTSLLAAGLVRRTLIDSTIATKQVRMFTALSAGACFLLLHKCLTSDQPHPDNLHTLHAATLLLLLQRASESNRRWDWIFASLWASIGILTKQTAALAPGAVIVMLLIDGRRTDRQGLQHNLDQRDRWLLIALTVVAAGGVAGFLLSDPIRDFHLRTALGAHPIDWNRFTLLLTNAKPILFFPRFFFFAIAVSGLRRFYREPTTRSFAIAWCAIGFFEVLPACAGFVKVGGNFNNLGVIDFWLFLAVAPYFAVRIMETYTNDAPIVDRRGIVRALLPTIVGAWWIAALWPIKLAPNEHCFRLGREVEQLVYDDVAAGRRPWLNAGLSCRIRAGDTTTPRDIGIALWTLEYGAETDAAGAPAEGLRLGIHRRLTEGEYDRIYDFFPWKLKATNTILQAHYSETEVIKGAGYSGREEYRGIQPTVNRCTVYALDR